MVEYHVDGWNLLKLNYSAGILWTEVEYGAGGEAQKVAVQSVTESSTPMVTEGKSKYNYSILLDMVHV